MNSPNNDELGEMGQAYFSQICARTGLVCNQAKDRDRTGWDFIVEFKFPNIKEAPALESRGRPISCHIQVKTMHDTRTRFQMPLSSAEYLAKEQKPSFVYVLRVNNKFEFVEAFLIHILDDPLSVILKRLRQERAAKTTAINKKRISLSIQSGIRLDTTGDSLRGALEKFCGHDAHAYVVRKNDQLEKLGFEGKRLEIQCTLHAKNTDELVDVFLGLKSGIRASNTRVYETRFGIKIPEHEDNPTGESKISISPSPVDRCPISFREDSLSPHITFDGEIYLPAIPNLPSDVFKCLVKTELFS
jgi:hypothetical protein